MLEPREADIPVLFIFFVVIPVVTYILLGKWNDASKKNARVSTLAQLAAKEAFPIEAMSTVDLFQSVPIVNTGTHYCARCFSPANTRCSRCKSTRYCSGKCQIIHWRQGHNQECQHWETQKNNSSIATNNSSFHNDSEVAYLKSNPSQASTTSLSKKSCSLDTLSSCPVSEKRRLSEKCALSKRECSRCEQNEAYCLEGAEYVGSSLMHSTTCSTTTALDDACRNHKSGDESRITSENSQNTLNNKYQMPGYISSDLRSMLHETCSSKGHVRTAFEATSVSDSTKAVPSKGEMKLKKPPYTVESSSSQKASTKSLKDTSINGREQKSCTDKEQWHQDNGKCHTVDMKISSTKKLHLPRRHVTYEFCADTAKKNQQVLFPFEELVKFFQCEVFDISPRGLINCGNSCYANAVLQCLTYTKPLLVYLLRRMHSRSCCLKEWCLMCELELHVALLPEGGGPLSPNKILSNMTNIGCRIGGGNQEDAHEFLRLLVMSMQSICLESLGGEKKVDPRLQETTLIQQIFGGRLKSKVKCLRCEVESERYENIMDLTLEIHGWVESLEDALAQFTAPEDLDGDNMYKCGRCSTYVRARKQLRVHEAPNILTIVLKRFQTGKYGKINKCVTFPDMLDMIPYMTGTGDSPPLYLLYAVVVHLDTLNASFSGHYVCYVKDLQGIWYKIDDTEVQPVHISQVMSEGAYMLFYSRSFPRPPRMQLCKRATGPVVDTIKTSMSRPVKSSTNEASRIREKTYMVDMPSASLSNIGHEAIPCLNDQGASCISNNYTRGFLERKGSFSDLGHADFSDAAQSSDWSIFTSSDESSFTTESTSDSFSNVDQFETANLDPVSSLFSPIYIPEYSQNGSVHGSRLSHCGSDTRFFTERPGIVFDSRISPQLVGTVHTGRNLEHAATRSIH